jgi:hypothetical protein
MLWLYNDYLNEFIFYQIYDGAEGIICDFENTIIYSLNCANIDILHNDGNTYDTLNYDVKIKDNLIMFENNLTNVANTFIFNTEIIDCKPTLKYTYKKIKNTKMPNLSNNLYDYTGTHEMKILKIKQNLLFIKETNLLTNDFKQYYITDNIQNIEQYKKTCKFK